MKLYKLTNQNDQTYGGCQWGENVTVETNGEGKLCGPGFTHWYTHPLLAVFLNPTHGNFDLHTAHLWKGEGEMKKENHGLKVGCVKATTKKRIPLPQVTLTQKVAFGVLCVLEIYQTKTFRTWAENWLSGKDRTQQSAYTAANIAAAQAAANVIAADVAAAAHAATYATAAYVYDATICATYAAHAATYAASVASAAVARSQSDVFDPIAIAKKAITY